jgi:hypothetical protein
VQEDIKMKEFTIIDLMKRVNNVKGDFLFKDLFTAKTRVKPFGNN